MLGLLSIQKLYTFVLLILPSIIAISWLNVSFGNTNYQPLNYSLTHILPAVLVAYIATLFTANSLHEGYVLNIKRVAFTFAGLVVALFLYSYVSSFFGFQSQFLTANIPSVTEYDKQAVLGTNTNQTDPRETASKFYSFQLLFAVLVLVALYAVASTIFKTTKKRGRKPGSTATVLAEKKESKSVSKKPKEKVVKKTVKKKQKSKSSSRT